MLYDITNSGTQALTLTPTLQTERLVLRGHRMDDLPARAALTADPAVMEYVGGCQGHAENVERIHRYAGMWAHHARGPFAVEEKATGRLLGEVGIADFPRGLGAGFDGEPEALWVLGGAAQGRGYAGEAMRAAIAWHAARFGPRRLVCIIAPANLASLRLAERLGFVAFDTRVYRDHPVRLLERTV